MVAALYVIRNGPYYGVDGVDPWDEQRDARILGRSEPVGKHRYSAIELMSRKQREATPEAFRDYLLGYARSLVRH